jgi:hypothetical protein
MHVEQHREHKWLQKLVGEWTFKHEMPPQPGQEPCNTQGTESVRTLGGLFIIAEGRGEMPGGGEANWILTVGYDPQKKHFVGSWVGSMMHNMWVYEGHLDPAGKTLTLETEGPKMSMTGPVEGTTKYREVMEITGENERTFSSHMLGDDGKWIQIMNAKYTRSALA